MLLLLSPTVCRFNLEKWPSGAGEEEITQRRVWRLSCRTQTSSLGQCQDQKPAEPGSLGPEVKLDLVGLEMIKSDAIFAFRSLEARQM